MLGRLFSRKQPDAPPRAHLLVHLDSSTGGFELEVASPFLSAEAVPVLDAALSRVRDMTDDFRQARVVELIRQVQRDLGILDKLWRRKGRWESEARNVVPTELFTGEAGRGLVEVTLDGEFGFVQIEISDEAGPEAITALAKEAFHEAERRVEARWAECLKGALEALPEEDKVELGLPAGSSESGRKAEADEPAAGQSAHEPNLDAATDPEDAAADDVSASAGDAGSKDAAAGDTGPGETLKAPGARSTSDDSAQAKGNPDTSGEEDTGPMAESSSDEDEGPAGTHTAFPDAGDADGHEADEPVDDEETSDAGPDPVGSMDAEQDSSHER